jgi:hypothetical protein
MSNKTRHHRGPVAKRAQTQLFLLLKLRFLIRSDRKLAKSIKAVEKRRNALKKTIDLIDQETEFQKKKLAEHIKYIREVERQVNKHEIKAFL